MILRMVVPSKDQISMYHLTSCRVLLSNIVKVYNNDVYHYLDEFGKSVRSVRNHHLVFCFLRNDNAIRSKGDG